MMAADLEPTDDAFIRTAIRGLRAPEHHPAFWSELALELDAADELLGTKAVAAQPAPQGQGRAAPEVVPLVVPLPETRQDPVPEPLVLPEPAPRPPRREPLRAPAHKAPAGAERIPAFGAGAVRASPAAPKLVVRHDPAVVPASLRRSSNAILVGVAVVAAVVALVAGLTLVRQRSDAGGPPATEVPSQPGAAAPAEPVAGPT